jgi:hypothetical protein
LQAHSAKTEYKRRMESVAHTLILGEYTAKVNGHDFRVLREVRD